MAEDEYLANNNRGQKEIAMSTSLCFKLKIPKSEPTTAVVLQDQEEEEEEEEKEEEDEEEEKELLGFACPVCDKRFKSGKALGGHKRMHNKKVNVAALVVEDADDDDDKEEDDVVDEEDVVVCPECSKSFPSKKSLFGHMRSHPERTWRGIHPPPPNSSCSISVVSDSPPVGWSVTGKRGRMSTTSSSASVESSSSEALERQVVLPGMDEDMKEAVLDLMLLAHTNPNTNTNTNTKPAAIGECRSDSWAAIAENDEPRKWSEEEDCSDTTKKKRKRPKMKLMDCLQKEEEEEEDEDEDEEQVELESSSSKQKVIPLSNDEENKKKKKKKKMKMMKKVKKAASSVVDDDATTNKVNKYVCSACDKSFASYQALGGHRSSHNKLPYLNKTNIIINTSNQHQHQHQHRVLNFDLNQPPPPEDEL